MPDHVFTFAARGVSVDVQTNTVTAYSITEQVGAAGLPLAVGELAIVTLWRRHETEEGISFIQRTQVVAPSGKRSEPIDTEFRFDKPRHRVITRFNMLPFHEAGDHRIETSLQRVGDAEWRLFSVYPLEVNLVPPSRGESLLEEPHFEKA